MKYHFFKKNDHDIADARNGTIYYMLEGLLLLIFETRSAAFRGIKSRNTF